MLEVVTTLQKDPELKQAPGSKYAGALVMPYGWGVVLTAITRRQFEQTETPIAERKRFTTWTFGHLPELIDVKAGGRGTIGWRG